jgi:hypothetical protein
VELWSALRQPADRVELLIARLAGSGTVEL